MECQPGMIVNGVAFRKLQHFWTYIFKPWLLFGWVPRFKPCKCPWYADSDDLNSTLCGNSLWRSQGDHYCISMGEASRIQETCIRVYEQLIFIVIMVWMTAFWLAWFASRIRIDRADAMFASRHMVGRRFLSPEVPVRVVKLPLLHVTNHGTIIERKLTEVVRGQVKSFQCRVPFQRPYQWQRSKGFDAAAA